MNTKVLKELIDTGREIEFTFQNKLFSITYYNDNRSNFISFCEFYKEPIDVSTFNELIAIKIDNKTLEYIINTLPNSAFSIF